MGIITYSCLNSSHSLLVRERAGPLLYYVDIWPWLSLPINRYQSGIGLLIYQRWMIPTKWRRVQVKLLCNNIYYRKHNLACLFYTMFRQRNWSSDWCPISHKQRNQGLTLRSQPIQKLLSGKWLKEQGDKRACFQLIYLICVEYSDIRMHPQKTQLVPGPNSWNIYFII